MTRLNVSIDDVLNLIANCIRWNESLGWGDLNQEFINVRSRIIFQNGLLVKTFN